MATSERNNKILLDLVQQPGNNLCADCGAPGEYTSTDSGLIYRLALIDFYLFILFFKLSLQRTFYLPYFTTSQVVIDSPSD